MADNNKPGNSKNAKSATKVKPEQPPPRNTPIKKPAANKFLKAQLKTKNKPIETGIEKLAVIILTDKFRIKCKISMLKGVRLTDFIRSEQAFIPVLNAEVWSLESRQKIITTEFLNVSKAHIQIITPDDLVASKPKDFDIPDSLV